MNPFRQLTHAIAHELKTLRGAFYRRLYVSRADERQIVEQFHRLYFDARAFNMTWRNTFWLEVRPETPFLTRPDEQFVGSGSDRHR